MEKIRKYRLIRDLFYSNVQENFWHQPYVRGVPRSYKQFDNWLVDRLDALYKDDDIPESIKLEEASLFSDTDAAANAISTSFVWDESDEGYFFWSLVRGAYARKDVAFLEETMAKLKERDVVEPMSKQEQKDLLDLLVGR